METSFASEGLDAFTGRVDRERSTRREGEATKGFASTGAHGQNGAQEREEVDIEFARAPLAGMHVF